MNKTTIKKFVVDNKVPLAFIAGVAAAALAVHLKYHNKTLLELPANAILRMKESDINVVYDVPNEGLFSLKYIPTTKS